MNLNFWFDRIKGLFNVVLVVSSFLFLASLIYMGIFALPTWDDLEWNSGIANSTYLDTALNWYSNMSGRYVFGFLMAGVVRLPGFVEGVPWLVPLGIALWILSSFILIRCVHPRFGLIPSLALTLIFCFFEVLCLPNIRHTFYF